MNFTAASMASDVLAVVDLLDKDAVWVPPGLIAIIGKEAIKGFYVKRFTDKRRVITLHPGAIQLMGDWAVPHSTFSRAECKKCFLHSAVVSGKWLVVCKNKRLPEEPVALISVPGTFCTDLFPGSTPTV